MWYHIKASFIGSLQNLWIKSNHFCFSSTGVMWEMFFPCSIFPGRTSIYLDVWRPCRQHLDGQTAPQVQRCGVARQLVDHWKYTGCFRRRQQGRKYTFTPNEHKIIDIILFTSVCLGYIQTKHATVWKNIFLKRVFIDMVLSTCSELCPSFFLTLLLQDIMAISQS